MKRLAILSVLAFAFLFAIPALAQDSADYIVLDDATPAIDVAITLPDHTTGTISLSFAMASVTLKDANDDIVFYASDERLHGVEFNIAPDTGTHTLTVERLPGSNYAYVNVLSLPEMTLEGDVTLSGDTVAGLNQEATLTINADNPGGTLTVDVPSDTTAVITTQFAGISSQTQLVDADGVVIAESVNGHVDGLNFVIDGGQYDFTIVSNSPVESAVVGLQAISVEDSSLVVIPAPLESADNGASTTVEGNSSSSTTVSVADNCTATVTSNSVNLRSGPGTAYSILGYGYRNDELMVGGINPEQNWVVVGTQDGGSAWLALSTAELAGSCEVLTVYDIPLRDASAAQIVITSPDNTNNGVYHDDDDHYEHDDDDHHEHDNHDD